MVSVKKNSQKHPQTKKEKKKTTLKIKLQVKSKFFMWIVLVRIDNNVNLT